MGRKALSAKEMDARYEYAKTHQPEDFAREFGLAVETARVYYSKKMIKKPRKPLFLDDEEAARYAESHTFKETSEHFNLSAYKTRKELRNSNIKPVSPWRRLTGDRNEMIAYLGKKFSYDSIGAVFDMTRQRVCQICKDYGDKVQDEECNENKEDT